MKIVYHSVSLVTVTVMLMALSARANLVTATDPAFGAGSLTVDTQTELAWLNLSFTAGLSYDQVLADMQPGGMFSNYTFASSQQVTDLYADAGIGAPGNYPVSTPAISTLISLVGSTGLINGYAGFIANSGTPGNPGLGLQEAPCIFAYGDGATEVYMVSGGPTSIYYNESLSAPWLADWLVTTVPEPGVGPLAIAGLTALAFVRRLKTAANENGDNTF